MDMSATAELVEAAPRILAEEASDDRLARRNALVLAAAQALAGANSTVIVSTGGIIGMMLAPDKAMATLPITLMIVGTWLGTLPIGAAARALGRRAALQIGSVFGVLGGLVGALAVINGSFGLFLLGAFCCGLYAAAHQSYRFAAADTASPRFRPRAVSWVLAGGVFAGVLGPQLVIFTKDLWAPYLFAATYVGQAVVAALAAAVLMLVRIPRPTDRVGDGSGRPLAE